jgi:hypothetical protein
VSKKLRNIKQITAKKKRKPGLTGLLFILSADLEWLNGQMNIKLPNPLEFIR